MRTPNGGPGGKERVGNMSTVGLTLFTGMERKLHWLSARQNLLARNVANAETPHYQAQDLKPFTPASTLELAKPLPLAVTRTHHLPVGAGTSTLPRVQEETQALETSPDGNGVSVEEQMMKVADTGMEYQAITSLYRKQLAMLKTALGRGGATA